MEELILALLMDTTKTIYEIKVSVATEFEMLFSDSLGCIGIALKNLLEKGLIICEDTHLSRHQKRYEITDEGREYFLNQCQYFEPLSLKNSNLKYIYFMKFLKPEKRLEGLQYQIKILKEKQCILKKNIFDLSKKEGKTATDEYKMMVLEYELDCINFNLSWYRKLLRKMKLLSN